MDSLNEILKSFPKKPGRSRLDPYSDLIKEPLGRGWTYREIYRILLDKCGVQISFSTIHHVVHRRSISRQKAGKSRPRNAKKQVLPTVRNDEKENRDPQRGADMNNDVYRRIAALKKKPISQEGASRPFHHDPDEPLHLRTNPVKDKSEDELVS
jgi:hypothetical protein